MNKLYVTNCAQKMSPTRVGGRFDLARIGAAYDGFLVVQEALSN